MATEAQEVHAYDQAMAQARASHPGHSCKWYETYLRRLAHYIDHGGDMSDAPALPDE